ncbi:unnamed protein product [Meganyctiphanes norvegica]|uniref:Uncharacterized protein n=1 Tax=Meganyctiphanes norvegica TaxID=48144 RepID=A0AAV2QNS1_MEGNR
MKHPDKEDMSPRSISIRHYTQEQSRSRVLQHVGDPHRNITNTYRGPTRCPPRSKMDSYNYKEDMASNIDYKVVIELASLNHIGGVWASMSFGGSTATRDAPSSPSFLQTTSCRHEESYIQGGRVLG